MFRRNRSFHLPILVALTMAITPLPAHAQPVEVYSLGGDDLVDFDSPPANPLPMLFVHGHNLTDGSDKEPNYKKNWVDRLCDLPSFNQALDRNPQLGIEPYYISFQDRHRPLEEDAWEIARAVDLILHRHDPSYDLSDPARSTHAQVAVIAMSKGTISSRLYLRWLSDYRDQGCSGPEDLPCVGAGFFPVSELIAIAPPNHGLSSLALAVGSSKARKQINNGYSRICIPLDEGREFIENLNDHSICDTFGKEDCPLCRCSTVHTAPQAIYPTEAPLSRAPEAPLKEGVLYLTLFAENGGDDFIGGDELSDDCQGRRLALNLSPHAVNVPLRPENVSFCISTTHSLTPHWPETICRALYTATHHRVPEDTFQCPRDGQVPVIPAPAPINAVLALDLSGSMGSHPCPTCGPKVEYLRQAAELFIKLWGVVAREQDRIGAVYFRSAASEFSFNGEALGPVDTHGQAIIDDLKDEDQQPSGGTAMGGALHSAVGTLSDLPPIEGASRHVIVFTDGMQNRNPMVLDDGGLVIADDPSRQPLPSGLAPIDLENLTEIKVHTIGIGVGDRANGLLGKIAEKTGGRFQSSFDMGVLKQFFIEKVIDVMRGFSPQLVAYRRGTAPANSHALETFDIDGGARRVIFLVSTGLGGEFNLEVVKGDNILTDYGQLVRGSFYRILTFDLPLELDGTTIRSGGQWNLLIRNTARDLTYEAAAIVDGVELHHEASLGATRLLARQPLPMTVRLSAGGEPVTGATVSARVLRSSAALGTLLATTPTPPEPAPVLEAGATGGQKKLQALVLKDDFWAAIRPVEALGAHIELTDHGDGTYGGSYDNTSIPGTYNVVFDIRGFDERAGGEYQRTETLSAQVEIGTLDLDALKPVLRLVDGAGEVDWYELTLRPRDGDGNYLGPDYGERIRLVVAAEQEASVVDRVDGSYEVRFSVPEGQDPSLELVVLGRPTLFAGRFSEFEQRIKGHRWVLSTHLGLTLPVGSFDRLYDPGPLVELDLEYAFSRRFALRGVLGRYRFDPGFEVDGATLYLRYYRPWKSAAHRPGSTRLFAELGPGVYDPDGIGSTAGLSVGFGIVRPFRQRFESELGAGYFHLFNPGDDLRFVALRAGLRYHF